MSFISNISAEFIKINRTFVYGLTVIATSFIPIINFMLCAERPKVMLGKFSSDAWLQFIQLTWKNMALGVLPMYLILLTNLIVQIEFRNNTWKQVYTLPRSYKDIFYSKYLIIHLLLIGFLILFDIFLIISAIAVSRVDENYKFSLSDLPINYLAVLTGRIYLGACTISAIQYWLSLKFRNFVIPLAIGGSLWLIGLMLIDWDNIIYYPYMYPTLMFLTDFAKHPDRLNILTLSACITFLFTTGLSFWQINSQREKG